MGNSPGPVPADVKFEFAVSVIAFVFAAIFYISGSNNIATGLIGIGGGLALGGFIGTAKHLTWFGAPKQ
ncbi:MAG: hypothetical protein EAZ24_13250 [Burkholderiales bacterium]|nr:MAG: hypothetical protein EAZ24_13250 [Burkholderiales bacterium]